MPTLPLDFKPIASHYSHDGPGGVMRTEVGGGAPRYGLDWDRGPQRFNITLVLTPTQFSVWVAFYTHIIKKGAISFDMLLDSGFGVESHTCNIMPDSYQAARTSGEVLAITFVVEAESKAYDMSATDAQNLLDLYNTYRADSSELLNRIDRFANMDSNVL